MNESMNIDIILPEDLMQLFAEAAGMSLAFVFAAPPDKSGNCDTRLIFSGTDIKAWVGDAAKSGEHKGRRDQIEEMKHSEFLAN